MAIDFTTNLGRIRLLISDVGGENGNTFLFQDDELEAILALEENDVWSSAATALRTIAANEAQVLKAITVLELETDGSKVAGALEKLADKYDQRSDEQYPFDIAKMGSDLFSRRELRMMRPEGLREAEEEE